MQGTFIGVLMSATLPARLGESSRAIILARRIGRARETLPLVLGTIVSQALLNLLALAILAGIAVSSVRALDAHGRTLLAVALTPVALLVALALAPRALAALADTSRGRAPSRRRSLLLASMRGALARLREGLRVFMHPRSALLATFAQLTAWGLQWASCWILLIALGIAPNASAAAAAGVLFAVNVTALLPPTPANVGVFQAACVAVLAGAYHVDTADAIAYGIVLQAVELATALVMGVPALLGEGLTWREVRLRTMHTTPVRLPALPASQRAVATGGR
jgi:phosphatidylinositol alpha-mannosyltransferase